ncbi:hypothetical protein MKX03_030645 [Papaver bracteatum]|nr:hypothetical protein MKX03_030645 [Papaver bracteatum]
MGRAFPRFVKPIYSFLLKNTSYRKRGNYSCNAQNWDGIPYSEEIYECYRRYAKWMGFPCKKRSSKKDNGLLRHVTFTCRGTVLQVWASYCKLDDMPEYYVEISRLFPDFKLYAKWLEPCAPPREVIKWLDEKMPVFNDTGYIPHLATGVSVNKQSLYEIHPKKQRRGMGDVYDVRWLIVLVLVQVAGFETVFKAKREAGHDYIMGIPWIELFRFSHQIPAFRFTEVRYGSLRGCLELDPISMPACLFPLK